MRSAVDKKRSITSQAHPLLWNSKPERSKDVSLFMVIRSSQADAIQPPSSWIYDNVTRGCCVSPWIHGVREFRHNHSHHMECHGLQCVSPSCVGANQLQGGARSKPYEYELPILRCKYVPGSLQDVDGHDRQGKGTAETARKKCIKKAKRRNVRHGVYSFVECRLLSSCPRGMEP